MISRRNKSDLAHRFEPKLATKLELRSAVEKWSDLHQEIVIQEWSSPGLVKPQLNPGERLLRASPDTSVPHRAGTGWTLELKLPSPGLWSIWRADLPGANSSQINLH